MARRCRKCGLDEPTVPYDAHCNVHGYHEMIEPPYTYKVLSDLSTWCASQHGAVVWTLTETIDNGRRGFQLFIVDHEAPHGPEYLMHRNANDLVHLADLVAAWLAEGGAAKAKHEKASRPCRSCGLTAPARFLRQETTFCCFCGRRFAVWCADCGREVQLTKEGRGDGDCHHEFAHLSR